MPVSPLVPESDSYVALVSAEFGKAPRERRPASVEVGGRTELLEQIISLRRYFDRNKKTRTMKRTGFDVFFASNAKREAPD